MAITPSPPKLVVSCLFLFLVYVHSPSSASAHQLDEKPSSLSLNLLSDPSMEWASASNFPPVLSGEISDSDSDDPESVRRSLFWRTFHYYISYGALSANRIPCPPRSGRSYYTNNCYRARGPVHPYRRGCSAITRCSR